MMLLLVPTSEPESLVPGMENLQNYPSSILVSVISLLDAEAAWLAPYPESTTGIIWYRTSYKPGGGLFHTHQVPKEGELVNEHVLTPLMCIIKRSEN